MARGDIYTDGFRLLSCLESSGYRYYGVGNAVAISKGDALIITSGYVALATSLDSAGFIGIAGEANTAAEASSNGAISVPVTPPLNHYAFMVPVTANAVLTIANNVGNSYDLDGSEDGLTIAAASAAGDDWGFFVDAIDIEAAALAAQTDGFAIGHFRHYGEA